MDGDYDEGYRDYSETDPSGRYGRYDELLGKGSFKTVYRAFDGMNGIEVAWNKVKLDNATKTPEILGQLYSEVHILQNLKHKNVMKIQYSWIDINSKSVNFISELFTSGTLREYSRKHKSVSIQAIKKWSRQILQGLAYLHSQDPPVLHRDLKCDNIFVNGNSGNVKIGDFGLATVLKQGHLTQLVGTPEFMAPEMYDQKGYNELVDIYSYGMCLVELLTLEYPYSECTNFVQIYKTITSGKKPSALSKLKDHEVRAFVERCLAAVSDRPNAKELLDDPFLKFDGRDVVNSSSVSLDSYADTPNGGADYVLDPFLQNEVDWDAMNLSDFSAPLVTLSPRRQLKEEFHRSMTFYGSLDHYSHQNNEYPPLSPRVSDVRTGLSINGGSDYGTEPIPPFSPRPPLSPMRRDSSGGFDYHNEGRPRLPYASVISKCESISESRSSQQPFRRDSMTAVDYNSEGRQPLVNLRRNPTCAVEYSSNPEGRQPLSPLRSNSYNALDYSSEYKSPLRRESSNVGFDYNSFMYDSRPSPLSALRRQLSGNAASEYGSYQNETPRSSTLRREESSVSSNYFDPGKPLRREDTSVSSSLYDYAEQSRRTIRAKGERRDDDTISMKFRIADNEGSTRIVKFSFRLDTDTAISVAHEIILGLDLLDQDVNTIAEIIDAEVSALIPDWNESSAREDVIVDGKAAKWEGNLDGWDHGPTTNQVERPGFGSCQHEVHGVGEECWLEQIY